MGVIVRRCHNRLDPAANRKIADDGHAARLAGGDQVVEDGIRYCFVIDATVPKIDHVVLQPLAKQESHEPTDLSKYKRRITHQDVPRRCGE